MNKTVFYTGVLMLIVPIFIIAAIALIKTLIESGINFGGLAFGLCLGSYVCVALWCIIVGSVQK